MSTDVNPLKSDPELQIMLKQLDSIRKYKKFQGWKKKFLDRLESFLYEEGMTPAQKACNDFDDVLKKFVKMATKVQGFIEAGDLSNEKKSVKAALALNESCNLLTNVANETERLIPSLAKEEKKRGFTKFHLGAVLIRQGFHQYTTMKVIETALTNIEEQIHDIMDRQQRDLFETYKVRLQRFCDVMADLNLYEVMLKCIQFAEEPEDESEDPPAIQITINTHDGKKLTLELETSETVSNVKEAIADACGIPSEKQVLSFRGKVLENPGQSLDDCGIVDGSVLTVEPMKVPVTLKCSDGRVFENVMIDTSQPLSSIKAKSFEPVCGILAENQCLGMNGIPLNDDTQTAEFYGIQEGTVLELTPQTLTVNVQLPDGKTYPVTLENTDTTENIKSKIKNDTGVEIPRQVLSCNGSPLEDDKTVSDLGLKDGSTIKVSYKRVPVTVNMPNGKPPIEVMVDPYDSLASLKKQLEEPSGISPDQQALKMNNVELVGGDDQTAGFFGIGDGSILDLDHKTINVTVELPDGTKHDVPIQPNDNCHAMKERIAKVSGMPVPKQVLLFEGNEIPADSQQTAEQHGIKPGSVLRVNTFKIPVTVHTLDGKSIKVMVDPTDTLGAIKATLEKETRLAPSNQRLFLDGDELADDSQTAGEYGIKEGSELNLEPTKFKVNFNMPNGKSVEVDVSPDDTTADLKKKVESETGMQTTRQVLCQDEKELPNDGKTVRDMGILPESTIDVSVFKVPITVKTRDGKGIKVWVDPTDTLGAIKKSLEDESGIPMGNQSLFMDGKELDDDSKTAAAYGIGKGSELDLEPKSIRVSVEMPDGTKHDVPIKLSDTSNDIKQKIAEKTGMPPPEQVLKIDGKQMPDGTTARDLGLEDGSKVQVVPFKIPITVRTMDGNTIKVMVDPNDSLRSIKKSLESDSGLPASNQSLFMNGKPLSDDEKALKDYGIRAGSELDLEPKKMKVYLNMPEGSPREIYVEPNNTTAEIRQKIATETGLDVPRQVLSIGGRHFPENGSSTANELGIREGTTIDVDILKVPIKINTHEGETLQLLIEPLDNVDTIKKFIAKQTGLDPMKQNLRFNDEELTNGRRQLCDCGITAGSVLTVEPHRDPIVFVDVKSGSLFAVDREEVLEKKILTPNQGNRLDFLECSNDSAVKDRLKQSMLKAPKLGIATQVVVTNVEVEDYDLEEAEAVKNKWGVTLKKREKNKAGEELIFVDPKSGSTGELSRKKFISENLITPVSTGNDETIKEAEKDTQMYDQYVGFVRQVYGIFSAS